LVGSVIIIIDSFSWGRKVFSYCHCFKRYERLDRAWQELNNFDEEGGSLGKEAVLRHDEDGFREIVNTLGQQRQNPDKRITAVVNTPCSRVDDQWGGTVLLNFIFLERSNQDGADIHTILMSDDRAQGLVTRERLRGILGWGFAVMLCGFVLSLIGHLY